MKKALLLAALMVSACFCGCSRRTDTFLTFTEDDNVKKATEHSITEIDFYARDLAVVTEDQNSGSDGNLDAGAVLLVDISDNETIYASNAYKSMYPASLVKLLTSLIVLEDGELTDTVSISTNAVKVAESRARVCGFKEGDSVSLETLLNCLLVYSGNDAAVAIAEHIAGSEEEFVNLMNKKAIQTGATASRFANPHGLHDDSQYITAYDIYLIFNKLLKYDTFRSIINKADYEAEYTDSSGTVKRKTFKSTNQYLTGDVKAPEGIEIIGGISGTTKKSGSCMILLCRDAKGNEYIAVILNARNSNTLYNQMSYLLTLTADI